MVVFGVDERDSAWEREDPTFRVYLQYRARTGQSAATETYDVTGADVLQVIEWARREAGSDRTFAVALVHDDVYLEQIDRGRGRGLVWLMGHDANRA
jgi:hypothetical protein